jgi:hypothetical protein
MRDAFAMARNIERINALIQAELRRQGRHEVTAVEAARWLDADGVLRDSGKKRQPRATSAREPPLFAQSNSRCSAGEWARRRGRQPPAMR